MFLTWNLPPIFVGILQPNHGYNAGLNHASWGHHGNTLRCKRQCDVAFWIHGVWPPNLSHCLMGKWGFNLWDEMKVFIQDFRQNHLDVPGNNTAFWSMGDMTNHDVDVLGCNSKHHIQYIYIHILYTSNLYIYNTLSISNYEIWLGLEGIVFWLFFSFFCFSVWCSFLCYFAKGTADRIYTFLLWDPSARVWCAGVCVLLLRVHVLPAAHIRCYIWFEKIYIYIIIYYIAGMSKPCARKQQLVECDGEMFLPVGFPPFFRISVLHSNITG